LTGLLEAPLDRDCAVVTIATGSVSRVELRSSAPVAWDLSLATVEQPFFQSGLGGPSSALVRSSGAPGCVCVGGATPARVDYDVRVIFSGVDDHADVPDAATPVVVDGPRVAFRSNYIGDVDFFVVAAQEGHHYSVVIDGDPRGPLDALQGVDPDALRPEPLVRTYADADLYIRVSDPDITAGTVGVLDLGLDDHGDDAEHPTEFIADDNPAVGDLPLWDEDWFTVEIALAGEHIIVLDPSVLGGDRDAGVLFSLFESTPTGLNELRPPEPIVAGPLPTELPLTFAPGQRLVIRLAPLGSRPVAYALRVTPPG
jgi:hypothetical protein